MPIDINALRADKGGNPALWREMTEKRFKPAALVDAVIELDEKWRKAQWQLEQGRKAIGTLQKELGALMKAKAPASETDALKARKAEAEAGLVSLEAAAVDLAKARDAALDLVR